MPKKTQNKENRKASTTDIFLKFINKETNDNKQSKEQEIKSKDDNVVYVSFFTGLANALNILNVSLDRMLASKKMLKFISLTITIIAVFILNGGSVSNILSVPTSGDRVDDVPVVVEGLPKDYVITGAPDSVDVILVGSALDIYSTKNSTDFYVSLDVSTLSQGVYTVELQAVNYPENLEVVVVQSTTQVELSAKATQTFPLTHRFINEDQMNQEYSVSVGKLSTETVEVKGSADVISRISKVEAVIDVANVTKSFTQDAQIVASDAAGNILDVEINPTSAEVNCSVSSFSKTVPIISLKVGDVESGLAIKDIQLSANEVTIFGDESALNKIDEIYVEVPVEGISSTITVNNILLAQVEGINKMSITQVNASVSVEPIFEKTIEGISIMQVNSDNSSSIVYDGTATVKVKGAESVIASLGSNNIKATVDITGLAPGEYTLPIVVTTENKYVTIEIVSSKDITITIN